MPKADRFGSIPQIDDAAGVKDFSLWLGNPEMTLEAFVAAPRFQPRHLRRPNIKNPGPAAEGASATPWLVMGFQQGDGDAISGKQGRCGQSRDACTDHNHT